MTPSLVDGDVVVASKQYPKVGQIAIIKRGDLEVIKRVSEVRGARFYLRGDNPDESTDSRHYGYVTRRDVLGTIMIVLPRATEPPKPLRSYGIWLGRLAAFIFAAMALIHLFRIDTFIPLLDEALPSGSLVATWAALIVILSEVFAIPFALRMRLSPLAQALSGALVVFAPLWWIAIDIMAVGIASHTGQLGGFITVPSTPLVLAINIAWGVLGYVTLHALGYNELKFRRPLRK